MKARKTRERILDASIELFNEKKPSNVSTVQISSEMNISPGNLYYYYANKEEVIRYIWQERMEPELRSIADAFENAVGAEALKDCFDSITDHCIRYSFFYTEMPTLFVNDVLLKEAAVETEQKFRKSIAKMYGALIAEAKARDIDEEEIEIVTENGMALFLATVAGCSGSAVNASTYKTVSDIVKRRMTSYLKPYFTDDMNRELAEII